MLPPALIYIDKKGIVSAFKEIVSVQHFKTTFENKYFFISIEKKSDELKFTIISEGKSLKLFWLKVNLSMHAILYFLCHIRVKLALSSIFVAKSTNRLNICS